jgi:hypothetical protein
LRAPQNYDALRDEHARQTQEADKQTRQSDAPKQDAATPDQQELEPTRPNRTHPSPPAWDERQGLEYQQTAATNRFNWATQNAAVRDNSAATHQESTQKPENEDGKDLIAADLKEAKESAVSPETGRDTGRTR